MADSSIITDGSTSFSGGVDSIKTTTVASDQNPDGLPRNSLAWLINATVRDGGITQRWGWQPICKISDGSALYQRGSIYEPDGDAEPYLIFSIGGHILKVDPETATVTPLANAGYFPGYIGGGVLPANPSYNPANVDQAFFCQGEQFLVIQAGDYSTLPLIWDGTHLYRSWGITDTTTPPGYGGFNMIPAAGPMAYYMGRLWYAQYRNYSAGDIVRGPSGSVGYDFRDSILQITENPMVLGGDGFTVPTNAGNIRALAPIITLDTSTGQGNLCVFTRKAVYALTVPITRSEWIAANANNAPTQVIIQDVNGSVNDESVVAVNGDLYFQSFEPGIRSLVMAIRYFQQPGNITISANVNRILQFNDRSLLRFSSGVQFDNRLLQTALPKQINCGVVHQAIVPLDFIPVSSFNQNYTPVWEGSWEGLQVLQLLEGDFGGRQRAFATMVSEVDGGIYLWELTDSNERENGDQRVTWQAEFPSFNWSNINQLKHLEAAEIWVDRVHGTVEFSLDYRPDGETCWIPWAKWKECGARNVEEMSPPSLVYPAGFGSTYAQTRIIGSPPKSCSLSSRPSNIGYQFQPRLTIKGYCRVRGILLHATEWKRALYDMLYCTTRRTPKAAVPAQPPNGFVFGNPDENWVFGDPGSGNELGQP